MGVSISQGAQLGTGVQYLFYRYMKVQVGSLVKSSREGVTSPASGWRLGVLGFA